MSKADQQQTIQQFLDLFKDVATREGINVSPREKNKLALIELGLTAKIRTSIIMNLTTDDYVCGPEPDLNRKGEVWVFGTAIQTIEIYIKIKVAEYTPLDSTKSVRQAVCISFHPAEEPLQYPLKS
jgi:hypothetical protein